MNYKSVQIRKGKEQSLLRKHPWVFSGAIFSDISNIEDGEVVLVEDYKGRFLALGHFQHATISVRVLSFEAGEINQEFFNKTIGNAVQMRLKLGLLRDNNNIFRVCHGEGDNLPGLIVDFYNGVAVIQCHSIGMYQSVDFISNALKTAFGNTLTAVYSKSSDTLPERIQPKDGYIFGNCETPHLSTENDVDYQIDWVKGQKTGFFIDQRENRALLGRYSFGKKILNTFCYSGGFSLQALNKKANIVHSLDSSKKAIELTDANVAINNFEGQHDYKRLNAHAIRQIKSGGLIFSFSCSQVVDKYLFTNTIIAAAIEAGRNVRILEQLHQPADHPINAFHPEGEYLKGLVIQVD
jgi:23S rRNA (cytosine1962-C5)-methyltransferase